ncbi:MAG: hypothetical protein ACYDBX_02760, partial [Patescibacteria group bacterium]
MLKNTNIFHGGIRLLLPVIIVLLVGFLVLGVFSVKPINAQPSPYLNYQGRLENSNGNLLTGNYYVAFCIYTSTSATACAPASTPATGAITTLNGAVWGEVQYFSSTNSPSNEVENGVFNANLGLYSPITGSLFNSGSAFYLGVNVYNGSAWDGQMTPLQQIDQVAYAMDAASLNGYGAASPTGANQLVLTNSSGYITLSGTNPQINSTGSNELILNGGGGTGNICFFSCTTSNITSSGNELLSGNIQIQGASSNTISGNTTFNNNITVSGSTTTVGIQNNGNLTNTGTGSFGGNVTITGGTLNLNNTTSNAFISTTNLTFNPINTNTGNLNIQTTTPLPTPINQATSVEYNGYVYEIGGYNAASNIWLSTVDYAPINANGTLGSWTATTSIPVAIYDATSVEYNGYVYEIGGYNATTGYGVSTVDYAPINSNGTLGSWTPTTSLPTATYSATSVVYNGYVYEIGGSSTSGSTAVVDYAPINSDGTIGAWVATTSLLQFTYQATSVVYNGYVYEIGGSQLIDVGTTTVDYAPINSNGTLGIWAATTSLPAATYGATSVIYNGYVYDIGANTGAAVYYALILSSGALGSWVATTSLLAGTQYATSVVYNGYVYEIGGYTGFTGYVYYFSVISGNLNITNSINNNTLISLNGFTGDITTAGNITVGSGSLGSGSPGGVNTINGNTILTSADLNVSGLPTPTGLAPGSTSNTGGLLPSGTYYYEVIAQNITPLSTSTSFPSQDISVTVNTDVAVPTGVSATVGTSGTVGSYLAVSTTYYYVITATTPNGETTKSLEVSGAEGATAYPITISWTADSGATGYRIYKGTVPGGEQFLASVSGGSTTSYVDSGNTATVTWQTTTSLLNATEDATSVVYNGYVYEIGGVNSSGAAVVTVEYAPINTNGTIGTWTANPTSLLNATEYATSVVYNGYVYEIGGYTTAITAAVEYAPINTNGTIGTWTANPTSLLNATYSATSVVYNGYVYEIGGYNGSAAVAAVDYLNLSSLSVPPNINSATTNTNQIPLTWNAVPGAGTYNIYRSSSPNFTNVTEYISNTNAFVDTNVQQTTPLLVATYTSTSVVYNGYVYEIGGENSSGRTSTVDYAPINTNGTLGTWTATTSLPVAINWATSVVYNGYIYEIGGYTVAYQSTVYYAPINSNGTLGSWMTTTPLLLTTANATSVVYNGYVYEIGGYGYSNVYYANIHSDGRLGSWTPTTNLPTSIDWATSVVYKGYVYEIGGGNNGISTVYYSPINSNGTLGSWTATTSLPVNINKATSVIYNGYVYEIGGYNGSTVVATVYYAPINSNGTLGSWTATTSLPQALYLATSVVYRGFVYEIGGYTTSYAAQVYYFKAQLEGGLLQESKGSVQTNAQINQTSSGNLNLTGGLNIGGGMSVLGQSNFGSQINLTNPNNDIIAASAPLDIQSSGFSVNLGRNNTLQSPTSPAVFTISSWTANPTSLLNATEYATSVVYNGYVYEIGGVES